MKLIFEKLLDVARMRSLRARIFIILLIAGIVPSVLMRYAIVSNYGARAVSYREATVANQLMVIANHLVANNYFVSSSDKISSRAVVDAELEMISNLYEGRVMIIGSNFKVVMDTYDLSEGKIMISEEVIKCFQGTSTSRYDQEHGYIEMTTPIVNSISSEDGESSVVIGVMLTSISDSSVVEIMELLYHNAMILELIMIIVIFAIALMVSSLLVRPFERVTKAINEVKAGYRDETISVPDYVETVHIVDAFNQLQRRMKALDDSREEFVANVSHELKTPMASVKVLADSLLAQPDAPNELYREFLGDIVSEIDRENQIITDLLALVRMDRKNQNMNITPVDINNLAEMILKRLRPLARERNVEVVLESRREIVAEVDEVKITLLLSNLVENAIKYNIQDGWVRVVLDADHQFFTMEVSDSGIGMPQEALEHIYERFYRVDKSHSREIGGTGLGLAITRNAVMLHKGSIVVNSVEGEGSCFTVKIPLKYIV